MEPNRIIKADCVKWLNKQTEPFADLIFADPPFNIGYKYDLYQDRKRYDEYYAWTESWMSACYRVLKSTGSFWVAIGDDYAAEVRLIARKLGLHLRNWVIWHYTFGQSTKRKFARSHTHLFYWTADAKEFVFNDMAVRIPSARQTTYADRRANPVGKLPDDIWSFSRLCGTFLERVRWHPCQMPERVLERIIRVSSNEGQIVLDPFSGSGTTCCVAARLKRRYLGLDISKKYVTESRRRLEDMLAGRYKATDIAENPESLRAQRVARRLDSVEATMSKPRRRRTTAIKKEQPVLPGLA